MRLRDDIRQTLAEEFRFATDQMEKAGDLLELAYYYSALYSAVNRAFNLEWNRDLALLYAVLNFSHAAINGLAEALGRGQRLFGIPTEIPLELTKTCRELADKLASNTLDEVTLYPILARIAELSYATTGNGRYNLAKGNLKI